MNVTDNAKCYSHVFVCAGCDLLSVSDRSDKLTCSPACRVKAHRNGSIKRLQDTLKPSFFRGLTPAFVLRCKAAERLLGEERVMAHDFDLDAARGEIFRAFWSLVEEERKAA